MILRRDSSHQRKALVLAAVVACVVAACGGSTTGDGVPSVDAGASADGASPLSDAGSSNSDSGSVAKPQAILTLNGGAAAGCVSFSTMKVGDFGDQTTGTSPRPVVSGDSDGGKVVTVTCRVAASGAGFELQANIVAGDASLSLQGTLDAQGKTTAASFLYENGPTKWTSTTCSTDASMLPAGGVAKGRFWAQLTCAGATANNTAVCDLFGQIRVENCVQQ